MSVEYTLEISCVEDRCAPSADEWGLEQMIYLTSHFQTKPIVVHLKEGGPPKTVTIRGTLPPAAKGRIPATAAIGFASIAFHHNATGVPARVELGTSHIMLTEMENGGRPFSKDVHIQAHTTADKYEKAVLRVTRKQVNIDSNIQFAPVSINANAAGHDLQQLLQQTYNIEMKMGNTIPGTHNIRCFLDISEAGIQLTGTYVPALAYIHGQVPVTNELFWQNAINNVLERDNRDINYFLSCKDKNEQARITFLTLDYPITTMPYIADEIDRRSNTPFARAMQGKQGYEQFSNSAALLAGDCEDFARGGNLMARALLQFAPNASTSTLHGRAIKRMAEIMDQYVLVMSLCVVHGAKAGDSASMPVGAHMANVGMPVKYFRECLERSDPALARRLPWPARIEDGYETQMLEGTGMLDPRGYKDPLAHVRSYVRLGATIKQLHHPMIMEHGKDNPFFLGVLQGWTTYFTDRGASKGIGGFWFTDAAQGTRGAMYTDVTSERAGVALRMMPEAPRSVQRLMIEANTYDIPPQPFVLSRIEDNMRNHILDRLCSDVEKLQRNDGKQHSVTVNTFLATHQLSSHVADGIYTDIRDTLKRVHRIEYKREAVTDAFHGYRLTHHVYVDN